MVDSQEYIIFFLIWLITIIFLRAILSKIRGKAHLPPSPRALPIIGHMHLIGPIPHQALTKLSNRYGPLVYFYIGSKPCVLVSSQELAKEVFKNHETTFLNRPKMANLDYLTYGTADMAMAPYGPLWKFMKKLCMSELLGTRTLDQLLPVRREEMKQFVKIIQEKAKAGEAVDIGVELMRLTNNIISRMLLSKRCSDKEDEANEVQTLVKEMNNLGTKFNLSDLLWFCKNLDLQGFKKRLKDVRDRYDILMEKIILEHKEARNKNGAGGDRMKDVLDILIDISEDENAEMKLTRENIKAFVMNFFGAGTDTSSITIGWGVSELINHPSVMEKARKEIDTVVGRNRILEESDVENLPYLQAIVKETLRLHPGGPLVVRESTEDCIIGGYEIPKGTRLFVNVWALGRDPKQWESPLEFVPERFLSEEWRQGKNQFLDVRGQHFSLLPFGSGRRGCPGASLALQVVPTVLGIIIQCFDWKVDGQNDTVNMEEKAGMTLLRAHPLVCYPMARLSPFPSI
ncbi:3,9-dihydroxypterocarpan 6A-monooxygenase-like [Herrania umbratica]|uniref:3,9-dihydroxypterocarpan 6A-monooxygenase-like n=1 Tax=Herrania umbratica TaxID=108875 RepID=A0A6J1A827_9ROSI|nr:3,9-dihydroxypterocarpan 6A-monooxygenase-like [Herrania umbratica]